MKDKLEALKKDLESALASVRKKHPDLEIALATGSGFSSLSCDVKVVAKLKGSKRDTAKIEKAKRYFKKFGNRLDLPYKEYKKARFNYDGEHFELVGFNKTHALVKNLSRQKTCYHVLDLNVVSVAIKSFRKEIGK